MLSSWDPYAWLGVPRDADHASIRAAYLRFTDPAARRADPDQYARAVAAYELLEDPEIRRTFDALDGTPADDRARLDVAWGFASLGNDLCSLRRFRAASIGFERSYELDPNPELRTHCDELADTACAQTDALLAINTPGVAGWIKGLLNVRFGPVLDSTTELERCRVSVRIHQEFRDQADAGWCSFLPEFPDAALDLQPLRAEIVAAAHGERTLEQVRRSAERVGPHTEAQVRMRRSTGRWGGTNRYSRRVEAVVVTGVALLAITVLALLVHVSSGVLPSDEPGTRGRIIEPPRGDDWFEASRGSDK